MAKDAKVTTLVIEGASVGVDPQNRLELREIGPIWVGTWFTEFGPTEVVLMPCQCGNPYCMGAFVVEADYCMGLLEARTNIKFPAADWADLKPAWLSENDIVGRIQWALKRDLLEPISLAEDMFEAHLRKLTVPQLKELHAHIQSIHPLVQVLEKVTKDASHTVMALTAIILQRIESVPGFDPSMPVAEQLVAYARMEPSLAGQLATGIEMPRQRDRMEEMLTSVNLSQVGGLGDLMDLLGGRLG